MQAYYMASNESYSVKYLQASLAFHLTTLRLSSWLRQCL